MTLKLAQKKVDCQQVNAERLRSLLQGYYRMLDVACELRAEETAAGADLSTRMAWASTIDTINGWISDTRRRLSAIARRGGHGFALVKGGA